MQMLMHLQVYKSAKSNSMEGELKGYFMWHLKVYITFSFREHLNLYKIVKKKIHLTLRLMVYLTVELRVYLKVHLRMQLIYIQMHKKLA